MCGNFCYALTNTVMQPEGLKLGYTLKSPVIVLFLGSLKPTTKLRFTLRFSSFSRETEDAIVRYRL